MKFDVDLDFANRDEILTHIDYTCAILESGVKHNSGIYVTAIPRNPFTQFSVFDYKKAEEMGYFKLDLLNQSVYKLVKSPEHMEQLMNKEPNWNLLNNREFVSKLVHIGSYYDLIQKLPEPINNVDNLSCFLAIIRPGKKHLQGLSWEEIEKSVWNKDDSKGYSFKKSHSLAYALLVVLNMNILEELKTYKD